jgi:hypothetical protein
VNQIYKERTESASKRRRLGIMKRSLRTTGTSRLDRNKKSRN